MGKSVLGALLAGLIATIGSAAVTKTAQTAKTSGWTCSLTGKTVQACCCTQQKDGKLYCTLAKKTVASCCCKAASAEKVAKK